MSQLNVRLGHQFRDHVRHRFGRHHLVLSHRDSIQRLVKQLKQLLKVPLKAPQRIGKLAAWSTLILFTFGRLLIDGLNIRLISGQLVIGGVPLSIILSFLRDQAARRAYFHKDGKALHDRLYLLGVEERIKDFYRPEIPDEMELDRYIHQLLYDRTGYVGRDYQLSEQNILVRRNQNKTQN